MTWREEWLPIPGYDGDYEVSNLGRVRSYIRPGFGGRSDAPRFIGGGLNSSGYPDVTLRKQHRTIHRLVMLAFVGPCPEGQEVRHLDGSRDNPRLENLAYGTRKENVADSIEHGTKSGGSQVKTHCKRGHEFTPENIVYRADRPTWRICRTCDEARKAAEKAARPPKRELKTHCIHGHPMSGENLLIQASGVRICRGCRRAGKARWAARQKAASGAAA